MGNFNGSRFIVRLAPFLVYSIVPIVVLGPLLLPGFILTIDMVFGPRIDLTGWFYGTRTDIWGELPAWALISGLSCLIPVWLVQKLLLLGILFVAGYSAHMLSPARSLWGKYFCGLLYVLNPFVYVRFMAGQWQFLAGYALAPLAIKSILSFSEHPRLKETIVAAALLSLVGVFSPHMMVMTLAAGVVIVLAHIVPAAFRSGGKALLPYLRYGTGFALIVIALSFYWWLPAFTSKSGFLYQIGEADLQVFSAKPMTAGGSVFWALASMHGFWRGGSIYISQILPAWYLAALVFIFLAIHGFLSKYRDRNFGNVVVAMGIIGIGALLLGSGASSPFFAPAYEFMFNKLFFLRAFRDSQKLVALLVLAYAYLGALGVDDLREQLRLQLGRPDVSALKYRIANGAVATVVLALPFVYSLNMVWGFKGQLRSADYPAEWQESREFFDRHPGDFTVLFLPWHGFITLSWAGQRVGTPAKWFFDRPVLQSESLEVGNIDNESTDPAQHYIGFLVKNKDRISNLGELLAPLNIKYVILAKEADYKDYDFLLQQKDLRMVLENTRLTIYENLHPLALFYSVDASRTVSGWSQWLASSNGPHVDSLSDVFPINDDAAGPPGQKESSSAAASVQAVEYRRVSPVRYELAPSNGKYVVASFPYDPAWRLDGDSGIANLRVTNGFVAPGAGKARLLYYSRYDILLVGYIVSGMSILGVGFLWYLSGRKRGMERGPSDRPEREYFKLCRQLRSRW